MKNLFLILIISLLLLTIGCAAPSKAPSNSTNDEVKSSSEIVAEIFEENKWRLFSIRELK